ncbi:MAG: cytochrome C oxidase subunit IV family protein [Chloroflexi bacterium]|nr:cytochrome C oxidase subunit IV family protein [Chloroflexota bacterium]
MSQETQATQAHSGHTDPGHGDAAHTGHPTPATYFKVAMVLTIITAFEVAIFYLNFLGHGIIPILALLSSAKFILVMMYYMHLRFDSRIFSTMFVIGLIVAAGVIFALMGLLRFFLS